MRFALVFFCAPLMAQAATSIAISPSSVTLNAGQAQQFTAAVQGGNPKGLTWSVNGIQGGNSSLGIISVNGAYTAPSSLSSQMTVTVTATAPSIGKSANSQVTINPVVNITVSPTTATLAASQSQQLTATVTGTNTTSVTWSLSPAVGVISSSGMYTAPSSVSSQTTVGVTATSMANTTKKATANLTIMSSVSIGVAPLSATVAPGQSQQFAATVSGTTNTAVTWSLNPPIGTISSTGLYTAPSSLSSQQTIIITAVSAADPTKSAGANVTVTPGSTVSISMTPASATLGASQSQQFTASVSGSTNTAVAWSLNPVIGTISTNGLYTAPSSITTAQNLTVTATSSADSTKSATASVALTATAPTLTVSTTSLPNAVTGTPYSATLAATGGTVPYTWTLLSGQLPPGIALSTNGALSGSPTTAGTYNMTVQVTDAAGHLASAALAVIVSAGLTITSTTLPNGVTGSPYTASLTAAGGTPPYVWTLVSGSLPPGITQNTSGALSGTPTATGAYSFTEQVSDAMGTVTTGVSSITIGTPSTLSITTSDLLNGTVGTPYSSTLAASGGNPPYTWSVATGALPAGLSLSSSGLISGTPTSAGWSGMFSVKVSDTTGTAVTVQYSMLAYPAFDPYYGLVGKPCPGGSTGRYYVQKVNSRWWMCSPAGNHTFINAIGAMGDPSGENGTDSSTNTASTLSTIVTGKYGDANYNWAWAQNKRLVNWGFNAVGQDSVAWVMPTATCSGCSWPGGVQPVKLPEFTGAYEVAMYAGANLWTYAPTPTKNLTNGTNLTIYREWAAAIVDAFDPSFGIFATKFFANDAGFQHEAHGAFSLGALVDDTDFFWGMGAGPDFVTIPSGHTNSHVGYRVAIASPVQTFDVSGTYGNRGQLFADSKVYSKVAAATPPGTCSIATPCSLRDFLYKQYGGNISALNTAWGSNYTTFDTTGTQVTNEPVMMGDGSTKSFTFTLAHSSVSPLSFSLSTSVGLIAGDCPWWKSACGDPQAHTGTVSNPGWSSVQTGSNYYAGTQWVVDPNGYLQKVTTSGYSGGTLPVWNSTLGGTTTMGSVVFTNMGPSVSGVGVSSPSIPDPSPAPISGLPYASYWCRAVWHGVPSGVGNEVGITVLAGNGVRCGPPNNPPPPGATGWDVYSSCMNQVSPGVSYCNPPGQVGDNMETLQATNIPLGSSWTEPATGLVAGAALPSLPRVNYSNGTVTVTFPVAPPAGLQIFANYVYGGWGYGTGLMDEDGRNTAWLGSNPICLVPRSNTAQPGDSSFTCDGVVYSAPNANANVAADLDLFIEQFAGKYFQTIATAVHAADPGMLYMGADTIGTFGVPASKHILKAAGQYIDLLFTQLFPGQPDNATYNAAVQYTHANLGDKPLMEFITSHATNDSFMYKYAQSGIIQSTSQENRGANYYTWMNGFLNSPMADGTYPWVGSSWWGLYDFWSEKTNWGLISLNDNPYDGKSSCQAPGIDPWGKVTGNESVVPAWQPNQAYTTPSSAGDMIQAAIGGSIYAFRPTVSGTSANTSNPTASWPTTLNATVTDGTVTWQNVGARKSPGCFGDVIDYLKQANALWWQL